MTGVEAEYLASLKRTGWDDQAPLRDAGVGGPGLAIGIALAPISVSRSGLYQPDPDGGGQAFIIPVRVDSPITPEAADPVVRLARRSRRPTGLLARLSASLGAANGTATWLGCVEPQYMAQRRRRYGALRFIGSATIAAAWYC